MSLDFSVGYEKHDQAGNNSGNSRNGKTTKGLKGDFGEMPLETQALLLRVLETRTVPPVGDTRTFPVILVKSGPAPAREPSRADRGRTGGRDPQSA